MSLLLRPIESRFTSGTGAGGAILTVPAGEYWKPTSILLSAVTSADAGTRLWQYQVIDADAATTTFLVQIPVTQAASLTRHFSLYGNAPLSAAYVNTLYASAPLPDQILYPGATLGWDDVAAISETDALTMKLTYTLYQPRQV